MSTTSGALSQRGGRAVEVQCQAKVNLRLHVLAREDFGFHQIETLFLRLELADTLRLRRTTGARTLDVAGDVDLSRLGPTTGNLAWRAADAYLQASGEPGGFAIEIDKRIPLGGGLGGGSANAGAVLRALNATSPAPMRVDDLLRVATSLGSDVPFLSTTVPYALAWGRGQRMLALPAPELRPVVLVFPNFSVDTAQAYGWLDEWHRNDGQEGRQASVAFDAGVLSGWAGIAMAAVNDFSPSVGARHGSLEQVRASLLQRGCDMAMMTGSGSTVFGILPAGPLAADTGDRFSPESLGQPAVRCLFTTTAVRVEPISMID